jgi:hypothetical protein
MNGEGLSSATQWIADFSEGKIHAAFVFLAALSSVVGLKTRRERIDYTCELFDTMIGSGFCFRVASQFNHFLQTASDAPTSAKGAFIILRRCAR